MSQIKPVQNVVGYCPAMRDAAGNTEDPKTPVRGKGALRWRWVLVALVALGLAGGAVWWRRVASAPPLVQVVTLETGPVTLVLAVNGRIAARDQVSIRSAVSGTVTRLLVDEGAIVMAGDELARLDDSQQQAVVQQAQSALGQGLALQKQAEATYSRNLELGVLVARTRLEEARLVLDGAAQDVARLTAILDQARIQLDRYTIRAPMGGTVITRSVDPGQQVDVSSPLFTLADLSELVVETDVDEAYATRIVPGQPTTLQLVGRSETLSGSVIFVSPRVDPATGGLEVKIGFDTQPRAPLGLTVTANIVVGSVQALTVPRTALQGDALFRFVDGHAVLTPVTVTDWPAARLIVTAGVAAGDRVITDSTGMSDGLAVRVGAP